ncbi:MAG: Fur family transcriptional regulator [Myxococcota bacterium]
MSRFVPVGHEAHDACFAEEASQMLASAGLRVTRPRRAVVELLERSNAPLDPAAVHQQLKSQGIRVDRASVYRVLTVLEEHGLVHRMMTSGGYLACHPPAHVHLHAQEEPKDSSCHHHLICRNCRRAVEIHCDGLSDLVSEITRVTGFAVERHSLEVTGVCKQCQSEMNPRPL